MKQTRKAEIKSMIKKGSSKEREGKGRKVRSEGRSRRRLRRAGLYILDAHTRYT